MDFWMDKEFMNALLKEEALMEETFVCAPSNGSGYITPDPPKFL